MYPLKSKLPETFAVGERFYGAPLIKIKKKKPFLKVKLCWNTLIGLGKLVFLFSHTHAHTRTHTHTHTHTRTHTHTHINTHTHTLI